MSEQKLSISGNEQELRDIFFKWRQLIIEGKIPHKGYISSAESSFINTRIKFNPSWTTSEAYQIYQIIYRFRDQLKMLTGIDFSKIEPPKAAVYQNQKPAAAQNISTITYNGDLFIFNFPYRERTKDALKNTFKKKAFWDKDNKHWTVPVTEIEKIADFAKEYGFHLGESAKKMITGAEDNLQQSYSAERIELNIDLKKRLFDFQTVGVDFAIKNPNSINGDDMGLGKTPQGIGTAMGHNEWPVLVVTPKSLRLNWRKEFHEWSDRKVMVADSKNIKYIKQFIEQGMCHVLVINYDGLIKHFAKEIKKTSDGKLLVTVKEELSQLFKFMIVDEAHECRNPKTKKHKVVLKVGRLIPKKLLLTGTPFVNKVEDLAALLDIVEHLDELGGYYGFKQKYGSVKKDDFALGKEKEDNLKELNIKLRSTCFIRRQKNQVLKELPDKIRSMKEVELSNRDEYDHAYINLVDYLASKGQSQEKLAAAERAYVLAQMMLLKKLSGLGKVEQFVEFATSMMEQGEKLVVFVWHKELIAELRKYFPDLLEISGDVDDDTIQTYKEQFQLDEGHKLIVATYARGYAGHTLTASSNWCCLELPWNYAILTQAEDRTHRIGQLNTVYCHYFLGQDTIDERIFQIIESKRQEGNSSTGSVESIETIIQNELMAEIAAGKKLLIEPEIK